MTKASKHIAGAFLLAFSAAAAPAMAENIVSREATPEELELHCEGKSGLANFAVLAADTSRTMPFDVLSCDTDTVSRKDCLFVGKILNVINPLPLGEELNEAQKKTEERRWKQFGKTYEQYCQIMS